MVLPNAEKGTVKKDERMRHANTRQGVSVVRSSPLGIVRAGYGVRIVSAQPRYNSHLPVKTP